MRGVGLIALTLVVLPAAAFAEPNPDELEAKARALAERAAAELTGENAVPFISPAPEREQARKANPTAVIEEVRVPAGEVRLRAWLVTSARAVTPKALVVVLPGWHSNAGFALQQSSFLLERGYGLFIIEDRANEHVDEGAERFRGFVKQDLEDIRRALAELEKRRGRAAPPLVLYGFSWGGMLAVHAAAGHSDVKAVIVDGAPSSPHHLAFQTFEEYMPPSARKDEALRAVFEEAFDAAVKATLGYAPARYEVTGAVKKIAPRPLLVIHSRDDDFVPMSMAETIFAAAKEPKTFLRGEDFGHCLGMRKAPERYIPAVLDFLKRVAPAEP